MSKKDLLKELKRKLMVPTLVSALALTSGCSSANKESDEEGLYVETPQMFEYFNHSNQFIDRIFGLEETSDEYPLKLDYLLDTSFLTDEDYEKFKENYGIEKDCTEPVGAFAHLVDEKTITDKVAINDGATTMTEATFDAFSIIIWPEELNKYPKPRYHMNEKITVRKLKTMDYRTLYAIDSTIEFTKGIKKYIPELKEGDFMHCTSVYESDDGKLKEIYRKQTGAYSDSLNIEPLNYSSAPIITKVDETIFQDLNGTYTSDYILEALDTYLGTNNYYSTKNKNTDFKQFQKTNFIK